MSTAEDGAAAGGACAAGGATTGAVAATCKAAIRDDCWGCAGAANAAVTAGAADGEGRRAMTAEDGDGRCATTGTPKAGAPRAMTTEEDGPTEEGTPLLGTRGTGTTRVAADTKQWRGCGGEGHRGCGGQAAMAQCQSSNSNQYACCGGKYI